MSHLKNISERIGDLYLSLILSVFTLFFISCSDDMDSSNRYTFTGETIADYLENRPEMYSDFLYILERAHIGKTSSGNMKSLLSTYGTYTCFAPTNAAVAVYLKEQDSIYWENVRKLENNEISKKDFVETGIHSPLLSELSDSMASEIAKNHLLETGYLTTDLTEGSFPSTNMNDRYITLSWINNESGDVFIRLNNSSIVTIPDVAVENGVIQTIDAVLNPSTALLPDLLKSQSDYFSIFSEALFATGLDDSIRLYIDESYTHAGEMFHSAYLQACGYNDVTPYPKSKYYKYTILVEPNSVFEANGISSLEDLVEFANSWYGTKYYPVTDYNDYTSRNNPLNRFVAYHILDRQLQYASGSGPGGFILENYESSYYKSESFMRGNLFDRKDYFETLLPNTSVKVTRPLTNPLYSSELLINYSQDNGTRFRNIQMRHFLNVTIIPAKRATEEMGMTNFEQNSMNGFIHPIDKILVYNEDEMAGNVLYERMRWDFASFFPELTNNNIRWAPRKASEMVYIVPDGYCKRIKINSESSEIYYLCANGGWNNFEGDELLSSNLFDFEYRIPHVPAGNYELRFAYARYDNRSVVQFYLDGKVTGIPVDLRLNDYTENFIGWISDTELGGDEEQIAENDKELHNRNWMKAPDSFCVQSAGLIARNSNRPMRYVLGMYYLAEGDHWFRMKNVREDQATDTQGHHDYFEIVPKGIVTDITKPEDKH